MENAKPCEGQCQNCNLIQQTYCSAVRLHALMEHEQILFSRIAAIEEKLDSIVKRPENLIIAQGGDGAVKVASNNI